MTLPHDGPGSPGVPPPGFRAPDATRLGRVRLQVADLERSLAYYTGTLGLEILDRARGQASLGPSGAIEPLVELKEHPGAAPAPRGGRPGLYHYALLLPARAHLGAFVRTLEERGTAAGGRVVGAADHGVSEAIYLADPDGLGIEVYADRPRSAWRYRGGQLLMGTDPLDAQALAGHGASTPWEGLPPGTIVGHMHLHVGDLAEAGAFYHQGLGLDRTVWSYPGALFLSAGGYHHHLGLNTWARDTSPTGEDDARLLDWEVVMPTADDVEEAASSLRAVGWSAEPAGSAVVVRDPWGTAVRVRPEGGG